MQNDNNQNQNQNQNQDPKQKKADLKREAAALFWENLEERRNRLGIQMSALSERCGMAWHYLTMCKAKKRIPSREVVSKLADILECTTDYLYRGKTSAVGLYTGNDIDEMTRSSLEIAVIEKMRKSPTFLKLIKILLQYDTVSLKHTLSIIESYEEDEV